MVIEYKTKLSCPHCHTLTEEEMVTHSCQYLFVCPHCSVMLKPLKGDCCVFCSYGTVPCPPKQIERVKNQEE